jgi:hypothetical protein
LGPSGVDVIGIAAPIMETPTLRATLGDMQIPDIFDPGDVARNALVRLPSGCSYIYSIDGSQEASEQQTVVRRERVLALEKIVNDLFGAQ